MKFGAKLRNYGAGATMGSVLDEARRAEDAGFDSVWLSDHLAMPERTESWYPYAPGGRVAWDPHDPWLDPVVVLAAIAAVTDRVGLGVAVLVAVLREPIALAKQLACVTQLSAGRVVLGVGDGWLREELELFGVDFDRRRARTETVLDTCRQAWTEGLVAPRPGGTRYFVEPRPERPIPVFLGGTSESVLSRVAADGYGWLPLARGVGVAATVERGVERIIELRTLEAGSAERRPPRVILNAGTADHIASEVGALAALGVEEVLVEGEFDDRDGPARALMQVRDVIG